MQPCALNNHATLQPCGKLTRTPPILCLCKMPSGKTLTHKVEVACRGADAKALGKHRLETELGLNVTFQSYQVAPGKQKLWLEDDDPVVSGSVLNFAVEMQAVLHQQSQHTRILAMLSRPLLQDVVSRWTACLISSKATGVAALITNVQDKVAGSALHQSLASALTSINAEMTVAQLTAQLVETYQDQCSELCTTRG